jgi:hypothetical protein
VYGVRVIATPRYPRLLAAALAALLLAVAAAGCGGVTVEEGTTGGGVADHVVTAAGTTTTRIAHGAGGGAAKGARGIAALSPKQILQASAAALRGVRGYHLAGEESTGGLAVVLYGDVAANGDVRLTEQFGAGGQTAGVEIIVVGATAYVRGNRSFWEHSGLGGQGNGARILKLTQGRWIKVPPASVPGLSQTGATLAPARVAHCLTAGAGTLSKVGVRRYRTHPVVIVRSTPNHDGTPPGRVSVATTGKPYPLRIQRTGPIADGTPRDPACADSTGSTKVTDSDLALSGFDRPVRIHAPANPLDFRRLAAAGGTTA